MPSQAESDAAFKAAQVEARTLICHMVPPLFQSQALGYIESHPELVRGIADASLAAAEKVRGGGGAS